MELIIVLGKGFPFNILSMGSIQGKFSITGSDFIAFSIECSYVPGTAKCGDKTVKQTDTILLLPSLSSRSNYNIRLLRRLGLDAG